MPEPLLPHEPSASPVNDEPDIVIGSEIPAPAPNAAIALRLPSEYASTPRVNVDAEIVGLAKLVRKMLEVLVLWVVALVLLLLLLVLFNDVFALGLMLILLVLFDIASCGLLLLLFLLMLRRLRLNLRRRLVLVLVFSV